MPEYNTVFPRRPSTRPSVNLTSTSLSVLTSIYDKNLHRYGIVKEVKNKYNIDVPVQTVYSTVKKFVSVGWVESVDCQDSDGKDVVTYRLTDVGRDEVGRRVEEYKRIIQNSQI